MWHTGKLWLFQQVKVTSDQELLVYACEQFLGKTVDEIRSVILQTLEGHLRSILGEPHMCEDLVEIIIEFIVEYYNAIYYNTIYYIYYNTIYYRIHYRILKKMEHSEFFFHSFTHNLKAEV